MPYIVSLYILRVFLLQRVSVRYGQQDGILLSGTDGAGNKRGLSGVSQRQRIYQPSGVRLHRFEYRLRVVSMVHRHGRPFYYRYLLLDHEQHRYLQQERQRQLELSQYGH